MHRITITITHSDEERLRALAPPGERRLSRLVLGAMRAGLLEISRTRARDLAEASRAAAELGDELVSELLDEEIERRR